MSAFKAQALSRSLREALQLSIAGAVFSESADSSAFPILGIAAGGETIFVKFEMLPDPAAHVDGLGMAQRLYSPHICKLLRSDAATLVDAAVRDMVFAEAAKMGTKLEIWEAAAQPTSYTLAGASLVSEISTDKQKANPLTNSQ
jgi:hypothetical protein